MNSSIQDGAKMATILLKPFIVTLIVWDRPKIAAAVKVLTHGEVWCVCGEVGGEEMECGSEQDS